MLTNEQRKELLEDVEVECEKVLRELLLCHPHLIDSWTNGDGVAEEVKTLNELLRNNGLLKLARKELDWGK